MKKITNDTNIYLTRDLNEASVLLTMQRPLTEIKREGNICWFVFGDNERCEQLSRQYFFDTLLVDAKTLIQAQNTLKNRIFAKE